MIQIQLRPEMEAQLAAEAQNHELALWAVLVHARVTRKCGNDKTSRATAGRAGFTLIVKGSDFVSTSVIRWSGSNRATTFVSSTELKATILASDIAKSGAVKVTVFNSPPGGGTSNGLTFAMSPSAALPQGKH